MSGYGINPLLPNNFGLGPSMLGPASVQITVDPALAASDPATMSAAASSFSAAGGMLNINSISIGQTAPPSSAWQGSGAVLFGAAHQMLQGRASDISSVASLISTTLTKLAGQIGSAKAAIAQAQSRAASINAQTAQLNSSYQSRAVGPGGSTVLGPSPAESATGSDLQSQATTCMAAAQHANDSARQAFLAAGAAFAGLAGQARANPSGGNPGVVAILVAGGLFTPGALGKSLPAELKALNPNVPIGDINPKLLPSGLNGATNLNDLTPAQRGDMLIYLRQDLKNGLKNDISLQKRTVGLNIAEDSTGTYHFVVTYSGDRGLDPATMTYLGERVPGAEAFVDNTPAAGNPAGHAEASVQRLMSGDNVAPGTPQFTNLESSITNNQTCAACTSLVAQEQGVALPPKSVGFVSASSQYQITPNGAVPASVTNQSVLSAEEVALNSEKGAGMSLLDEIFVAASTEDG